MHFNHPTAFVHMDPTRCQDPPQFRLDAPIMGGENAGGATEEVILHGVGAARLTQHVPQPELHGQGQLDAACPCPHHANTDSVRRCQHTRHEVLPALDKLLMGLTGTTTCSAPGTCAKPGVEPILSDSTS